MIFHHALEGKIDIFLVDKHSKEYSGRGNRAKILSKSQFLSGKSVSVHQKLGWFLSLKLETSGDLWRVGGEKEIHVISLLQA